MKYIILFFCIAFCSCGIPASKPQNCYNKGVFGGNLDSSGSCEVQMEDESRFLGL